jgi:phosphogluconate dehydratase
LFARVDPAEWASRTPVTMPNEIDGMGRELFGLFRANANEAERGASPLLTGMGW